VTPPLRSVLDLALSRDGRSWAPFQPGHAEGGEWWMRFRIPPDAGPGAVLLLSGLGAPVAVIHAGSRDVRIAVHSYRQNQLPLSSIAQGGGLVTVRVVRDQIAYLRPDAHVKQAMLVDLEAPQIYEPTRVEIRP
jgi:hypothetical protein